MILLLNGPVYHGITCSTVSHIGTSYKAASLRLGISPWLLVHEVVLPIRCRTIYKYWERKGYMGGCSLFADRLHEAPF